jgi:hypothetical protein
MQKNRGVKSRACVPLMRYRAFVCPVYFETCVCLVLQSFFKVSLSERLLSAQCIIKPEGCCLPNVSQSMLSAMCVTKHVICPVCYKVCCLSSVFKAYCLPVCYAACCLPGVLQRHRLPGVYKACCLIIVSQGLIVQCFY